MGRQNFLDLDSFPNFRQLPKSPRGANSLLREVRFPEDSVFGRFDLWEIRF